MSLTVSTAPFGPKPGGQFNFDRKGPAHALYWENSPKRVRVVVAGETVADSQRVKLLHETGHLPVYYFPESDVRSELLEPSDTSTHCPFKGDASYWSIRAGGDLREDAVWTYRQPLEHTPPIAGYVAFYWNKADAWFEEDEEVFVHPRDPYHRVDVLESSRHVTVTIKGELVAETGRPKMLFESNLPPRYYIPKADVHADLVESETHTRCPYKGIASYHSVRLRDDVVEDVVWHYPEPLSAVAEIAGLLCFYNERCDLQVDGVAQDRPDSPFS